MIWMGHPLKRESRLPVQWLATAWRTEIQAAARPPGAASRGLSCAVSDTTFSLSKICRAGNLLVVRARGSNPVNRQRIYRING